MSLSVDTTGCFRLAGPSVRNQRVPNLKTEELLPHIMPWHRSPSRNNRNNPSVSRPSPLSPAISGHFPASSEAAKRQNLPVKHQVVCWIHCPKGIVYTFKIVDFLLSFKLCTVYNPSVVSMLVYFLQELVYICLIEAFTLSKILLCLLFPFGSVKIIKVQLFNF